MKRLEAAALVTAPAYPGQPPPPPHEVRIGLERRIEANGPNADATILAEVAAATARITARWRGPTTISFGQPRCFAVGCANALGERRLRVVMKTARPLAFLVLLTLSSCKDAVGPDGRLVGAQCTNRDDCDKRCEGGHPFLGMCTVSCAVDRDCPIGTRCVADGGGTCAVLCSSDPRLDNDCEDFGRGYKCVGDVCRLP